jgi:hypothetical protein
VRFLICVRTAISDFVLLCAPASAWFCLWGKSAVQSAHGAFIFIFRSYSSSVAFSGVSLPERLSYYDVGITLTNGSF